MPRYTTTEIINQCQNRLPDNTSGVITPAVLRSLLTDMVMTLRATGAYLAGTTGVAHSFASAAFQQPPGLYTIEQTRDATEISTQVAAGTLTALYDSDYEINGTFSVSGAANERLIAGVAVNGTVGTYFKSEVQMAGAANPVEMNIQAIVRLTAGQTVAIYFSAPTFPATITIANAALTATLLPSRV